MLFGELQRPGETLPKQMVQTLTRQYGERLRRLLEAGKARSELAGDVARIRRDAPAVFAIYLRGITHTR